MQKKTKKILGLMAFSVLAILAVNAITASAQDDGLGTQQIIPLTCYDKDGKTSGAGNDCQSGENACRQNCCP